MKRKTDKHILVLASTFPASDNDPVPRFVKEQVEALRKAYPNITFSVLAPHDSRSKTASFTKRASFDEYRFHYAWPHRIEKLAGQGIMPQLKKNPLYYLLIPGLFMGGFLASRRMIRKLHPDYVYAHWFTPMGVVAAMAARDTPVVLTTHALDVAVWHKVPFGGFIVRRYVKKMTAITAVSSRTLQKLQQFFSPEQWKLVAKKTKIIPMGVELPAQQKQRKTNGTKVVFIGRLAEKKGVHYLLPAFAAFRKKVTDAELVVAGDGPWLEKLVEQAKNLGLLDSVLFPGFVSGKSKQDILASADIYVVPSIVASDGDAEGLPVSLMEGLAYGKICIASRESGADDIISDSKDGLLVPQKDTRALTNALEKAAKLDDSKRQKMSRLAQETAQQFSWPVIAKQHAEFLFRKD
jgi:glycosyltransferase involved in cell wall biosynthesis